MKIKIVLICLAVIGFNSCLGASADITIQANGSGKIVLEYQVSQMLESIGRLDGNERWPAIPVGRRDFERSLARIPGLSLSKFSSRSIRNSSGGNDLVTRAELNFRDMGALLAFLDNTGTRASFTQENGENVLRLTIQEPSPGISNPELLSLLRAVSAGYEIRISLNAPKNANLEVRQSVVTTARVVSQGRNVSFAAGLGDIIGLNDGLALEIRW